MSKRRKIFLPLVTSGAIGLASPALASTLPTPVASHRPAATQTVPRAQTASYVAAVEQHLRELQAMQRQWESDGPADT